MERLRKIFAASVIFVTVLSMSVVAGPVKAAAKAGDLIKIDGSSTVYYLGADSKRYIFPNEATYFSWYKDFSGVVTVSQTELENFSRGAVITIRPGTKLIKTPDERTVYAVEPGGNLRSIVSESNAIALWGADWAKRVVDVIPAFMVAYKTGSPLNAGVLPAGSLVKTSASADVYYFDGSSYRKFASEAAAVANRFDLANAVTVSSITNTGTTISAAEASLTDIAGGAGGTIGAGSGLTVALSANTAASATVLLGQSIAELGSFNFTAANDGDVKVTSLKLKRIGISSDATLQNVYLYDGATRLTDASSPSSGVIGFNAGSGIFTVTKGTTKTITVKADIASTGVSGGQTVGVAINAASDVVSDGAAVSGAFPSNGNIMSTAQPDSGTLGAAAIGTVTSVGAAVNAGTSQTVVWSGPITNTNKASNLKFLSLSMIGTISLDSLANIKMFVNGVQAGSAVSLDANGRANFDISSSPVKLDVGSNTIEVRADVVKGSSRNFKFSLQNAADIVMTETGYGVNIAMTGTIPAFPAASTVISSGSITISQDPTLTTTTAVKGASGVEIAKFTMKAYGEDMKVLTLNVTPAITGVVTNTEGLSNVSLFVNGQQVGSSRNFLGTSTTNGLTGSLTFGTTNLFTILAGQQVTLSIKGDLTQAASSSMSLVRADLSILANSFQGVTSVSSSPTAPAVSLGQAGITITTGDLSLSKSVSMGNKTVLANTANVKIASFVLSAGSAEAVKVSNINIASSTITSTTTNEMANMYITDNTQPIVPQTINNFPVNFTIEKNSTKTVDVFVDLNNVATGTVLRYDMTVTAYGATTNKSVGGTVEGQIITVMVGTLGAPTLVSSAARSSLVAGGTSGIAAQYKFSATNGDAALKEMTFNVTDGTATATPNGSAITSLTVNGITAPVVFDGTNYKVSFTGLGITVPAGTQGLGVDVTASYNNVTSAGQGGSATRNWVKLNLVKYKYTIGNITTETTADVASNPMLLVASVPTVNLDTVTPSQGTGFAGGNTDVLHFNITAPANQPINLKAIGVTPVYSGSLTATATQYIKIYDSSDLNNALGQVLIGATSGAQLSVVFTDVFAIPANTTKNFVAYADCSGLSNTGNSFRLDLTATGDTDATTGTNWQWNDTTVSGTYGNGYLVKNLPKTGGVFAK